LIEFIIVMSGNDDNDSNHRDHDNEYEQFTTIEIMYHKRGGGGGGARNYSSSDGGGGLGGGIPSFVAVPSYNDDNKKCVTSRINNSARTNKTSSSSSPHRNNKQQQQLQQQGRQQQRRLGLGSKIRKFLYNNIEFKWLKFIQILCGIYILIVTFTYSGTLGSMSGVGARDRKTGFIIDPNDELNTRNGIIEYYVNPVFSGGSSGDGATVSRAIVASSTAQMVLLGLSVCVFLCV
jgi:hypothetical protein